MTEGLIIITTCLLVVLGLVVVVWSLFSKRKHQPNYNGRDGNGYQPLKSLEEIAAMTPNQQVNFIRELDRKLANADKNATE